MHRFLVYSVVAFLVTRTHHVMAHPGHGNEQLAHTPAHYLFEPFHALWTIAIISALLLISRPGRRFVAARVRLWNGHLRSE